MTVRQSSTHLCEAFKSRLSRADSSLSRVLACRRKSSGRPSDRPQHARETTEQSVAAIIEEMIRRHAVDHKQVYLRAAWSSSGPAVYATMLQDQSPFIGAFIAMSVFKPDEDLPSLKSAKGRRFYILHSPDDATCPYRMARDAKDKLAARRAGGVILVDYSGGHGWHGPVHDFVRSGIDWLQRP